MITLAEHFRDDLKIPPTLALELEKYHWDCLEKYHSLDKFYALADGLRTSLKKHDILVIQETVKDVDVENKE